ncbi:Serine/threonine protein kinase [Frankia canadensis]|uniref:Serine/threonine protein kinase n=1 Tax=Frankia canadensis TaxID=1836972 RepID=A0A2I2KUG6_9ACTN|nr:tetratricopeptide repeat protein [Frankia canadensis]SNQ49304.1 Serine/threonine protein kinase [Frankia canadensis]SOU56594.1 Serine/threonine protein kinase [Frankia canadensis]
MPDTDPSSDRPPADRPADPRSRLLADPRLPQRLRICTRCGDPVGRARGERPALAEGYCAGCGQPYSLRPPLHAGDRIGRWEIAGALAHGGQGWLYLARDPAPATGSTRSASGAGSASGGGAAVAGPAPGWVVVRPLPGDREFLTELDHPAIVRVHALVEHRGQGYAVLDDIEGTSLRELPRHRGAPLALPEAIDHLLAVLAGLAYLRGRGLAHDDLTPDAVLVGRDGRARLARPEAIHRVDPPDPVAAARRRGPDPARSRAGRGPHRRDATDEVRTVGRMLAGYAGDAPARHESLRRLLAKATADDPRRRFTGADELRGALLGVRREIAAANGTAPPPDPPRSTLFGTDTDPGGQAAPWRLLPGLLPDPADPAAGALAALPADLPPARLAGLLDALGATSPAARLLLADLRARLGEHDAARALLDRLEADDPRSWRVAWQRGVLQLATGEAAAAVRSFERVYDEVPGEIAPKLALGCAAEAAGDATGAARYYQLVADADPGLTGAAFALARVRAADGDRDGAAAALRRVAPSSPRGVEARVLLVRVLGTDGPAAPDLAGLTAASAVLAELEADAVLDPAARAALARDLLAGALALVTAGSAAEDPAVTVAGVPLRPAALRGGLERAYRTLARHAATPQDRHALVDLANGVRPRTLF